jgi:hypothetical protein
MRKEMKFVVFFTMFLASSCVSRPNRPDAPLCLFNSDGWVCTDARGDFPEPESNLICSTIDGYSSLERYIDELELRIRQLERRCKR